MKNVTITLDERTAAWVRVHAAEQGMSVSRFVGEALRDRMQKDREYEEAMRRFLARKPVVINKSGEPYPKREELYDRGRIR
jgi:hypothetical protein